MRMSDRFPIAARARRLGTGLVVLALVAAMGSVAGADTQGKLSRAEQKLSTLESTIHVQEQRAEAVRADLITLQRKVDVAQGSFDQNAELAGQVQFAASQLGSRRSNLDRLLAREADVLGGLNSSRASLAATLEAQRTALDDLNQTREQIVTIIGHLSAKLQAEAISGAGGVLQGNHNAPYGVWAAAFLNGIGAPTCFDNLLTMVTWQVQEGTTANWNPLATTYPMPGATNFNSVGVKNYQSMEQGLEATRRTLDTTSYGYPEILSALHRCPGSMVTARAINASSWCRGCTGGKYVTGLIATVEANYGTYSKL